jgi:hypothetical protein
VAEQKVTRRSKRFGTPCPYPLCRLPPVAYCSYCQHKIASHLDWGPCGMPRCSRCEYKAVRSKIRLDAWLAKGVK